MKICIVGASKRFTSGLSYYTICLSNALSETADVSTVCFRRMLPKFLFPGRAHVGKDIIAMNFKQSIDVFDHMDYNNPISWIQVHNFITCQNPDVIILQWWSASVVHMHLLIKLFAKLNTNAQIIIEFHEVIDPFEESILPIKIYAKFGGEILRRNLGAYITHSESDKQLVAKRYNINPEKIHVVPLGLFDQYGKSISNNEAKQQLSIKEEFVILSFGLIRRYKGIPYLISAFESLPSELIARSRLLIVGEIWEDGEAIRNQIKQSPYHDKITLINEYIPDDKINLYFSAANVVVLPYLRASQSGVAHIAMTFEKPIIVSNVGGLTESMKDYTGTYFTEPANIVELRDVIITCSKDHNTYNAPQRDWNIISARFIDIIKNIVNEV